MTDGKRCSCAAVEFDQFFRPAAPRRRRRFRPAGSFRRGYVSRHHNTRPSSAHPRAAVSDYVFSMAHAPPRGRSRSLGLQPGRLLSLCWRLLRWQTERRRARMGFLTGPSRVRSRYSTVATIHFYFSLNIAVSNLAIILVQLTMVAKHTWMAKCVWQPLLIAQG